MLGFTDEIKPLYRSVLFTATPPARYPTEKDPQPHGQEGRDADEGQGGTEDRPDDLRHGHARSNGDRGAKIPLEEVAQVDDVPHDDALVQTTIRDELRAQSAPTDVDPTSHPVEASP